MRTTRGVLACLLALLGALVAGCDGSSDGGGSGPDGEDIAGGRAMAVQACQAYTAAYTVGPSEQHFARAFALVDQAAQQDPQYATLGADMRTAVDSGDRAVAGVADPGTVVALLDQQTAVEGTIADTCEPLGVVMRYANGQRLGSP